MNKQIKNVLYFFVLAGIVAVLVLLACDDKKPTEPQPVVPKDYTVYFADINSDSSYYKYTPETDVLDSFYLPLFRRNGHMMVTPDGKELYLADSDSTLIYDLESGSLTTFPIGNGKQLKFSPDGKLIAREGFNFTIFRRSDLSVVYEDTLSVVFGAFSRDSKSYYGVLVPRPISDGVAFRLNLDSVQSIKTRAVIGSLFKVVPSVDQSKWFLYESFSLYTWLFEVYDEPSDSIIFSKTFTLGNGMIATSPDGRYVFISNPGERIGNGPLPPNTITVYDVASNFIIDEVLFEYYFHIAPDDSVLIGLPLADIVVTPDSKWLVGTSVWANGRYAVLDLNTLTFSGQWTVGNGRLLDWLTVQVSK